MGYVFLLVIALVFAVIWINLARRPGPRAKIGPDGTNVRNPETFVVHHEGKGQGLDIANTALKERTEHLSPDLPGSADQVKAPVPGRDMTRMTEPPSDVSKYGAEKVAPGAVPGQPEAEPKAKVLTEGPQGSRPGTPEEPGSPYAKGRRVTDTHRDVELAEETLPAAFGSREMDRRLAASPSTTGQEPGYGLGRTRPGGTDGEGGPGPGGSEPLRFQRPERKPDIGAREKDPGDEEEADYPVEQPEMEDGLTDSPHGAMPSVRRVNFDPDAALGPDVTFVPEPERPMAVAEPMITFRPDFEVGEEMVTFRPEPETDWSLLYDHDPLPADYGEDAVVAIVRNPRSLYVYWERAGGGEERLRAMLGDAVYRTTIPCLRLFDVTTGGAFAVDLAEHDDHWFVHGLEPGHRYVVSFERRTEDGRYYLLALSSPVSLPHESPATRGMLYARLEQQMAGARVGSPWR
ncbi:MAG: DUF4912 domain-containing protein [Bacillota bacterium]